jgi:hypothetical protein
MEARLETFGPRVIPQTDAWSKLRRWWLAHADGANTPNWDVALSCLVEGSPGLILIEAKANAPEISRAGKPLPNGRAAKPPSDHSRDNHERIGEAIGEARDALRSIFPNASLSHLNNYQLSNRIAFAWKLASLGVPTVLIYLGFIGDPDIHKPFSDRDHWNRTFGSHLNEVCAGVFWISRSRRKARVSGCCLARWMYRRGQGTRDSSGAKIRDVEAPGDARRSLQRGSERASTNCAAL